MQQSPVNLRNLERIQEGDPSRSSRLATLLLAGAGVAALGVVGVTMARSDGAAAREQQDPLAALVAETKVIEGAKAAKKPAELDGTDVTFPAVLSDREQPTTALAAVKDAQGQLVALPEMPAAPPPPTDRLPVVPLPVGTLLNATPVTTAPRDDLTIMAAQASNVDDVPLSEPGMDGGYQVQVASFKDQAEADRFVDDLRRRGHKAFRQAANVPGRGVWHRVRIGSFGTAYEATQYQRRLEKQERISAIVIDPEKVEHAQKVRAAKLAQRIEKYGHD